MKRWSLPECKVKIRLQFSEESDLFNVFFLNFILPLICLCDCLVSLCRSGCLSACCLSICLSVCLFKTQKLQYTRNWVALIAHGLDTNHDLRISPTELADSSDLLMKAVSHFIDAPNLNDEIYDFCKKEFFYVPPEVCCYSLSISVIFFSYH